MTRKVVAVVDDLFFASKIRGAAELVGVRVIFVKSIDDAFARARDESPELIITDLNASRCDPIKLATELKNDEKVSAIPLLGFFSHVQTELQSAAKIAGFDRVMPRSAFSKHLPEILAGNETNQETA